MDVSQRIEPRRASELLRSWFVARDTDAVEFREVFEPEVDPDARYRVAYEASFTPTASDRARAEVWVSDDGFVAFGFEREIRVGERLGRSLRYERFAAGIEPVEVSEQQLLSLLDLVADGRIALTVTTLPVVGVVSVRAFVPEGTKERAGLAGSAFHWLRERSGVESPFAQILTYEAW